MTELLGRISGRVARWRELDPEARAFYRGAYGRGSPAPWENAEPRIDPLEARRDVPAGHALDVGCGSGRHAFLLAESGWRVTAIDLEPAPLERARRERAHRGLERMIRFERWPASKLARLPGLEPAALVLDVLGPASDLEGPRLHEYRTAVEALLIPGGWFVALSFEGAGCFEGFGGRMKPVSEWFGRDGPSGGLWWYVLEKRGEPPVRRRP